MCQTGDEPPIDCSAPSSPAPSPSSSESESESISASIGDGNGNGDSVGTATAAAAGLGVGTPKERRTWQQVQRSAGFRTVVCTSCLLVDHKTLATGRSKLKASNPIWGHGKSTHLHGKLLSREDAGDATLYRQLPQLSEVHLVELARGRWVQGEASREIVQARHALCVDLAATPDAHSLTVVWPSASALVAHAWRRSGPETNGPRNGLQKEAPITGRTRMSPEQEVCSSELSPLSTLFRTHHDMA